MMMKPPRVGIVKLPLTTIIITLCVLVFMALLYAEKFSSFSSISIIKLKPFCPRKSTEPKSTDDKRVKEEEVGKEVVNASWVDDRFDFDAEECNVANGKWVFNHSIKPLYSDISCPYIERQFSCVKNGRNDTDYMHWEWQPEDCNLPRFNPELALRKLQGKRLMFVGDSLQRNQWESFVCLVEGIIPQDQKSMERRNIHSVFKAMQYNATIEFYWAPYIVESNSDVDIIGDPKKRIIKVDAIMDRAKNWTAVDILVFNTYVWWMSSAKIKSLWGSFANGEEGYEELDNSIAYKLALKTWANWVDSTINPNKTKVFFTTMSPTHSRSEDWGNMEGVKCFNETKPVRKKNHWGTGSNKDIMNVVSRVMKKMKVPVSVINITQISEYRIDGHSSVYTETGGKLLTEEERANPQNADCIHWCLPGIPDTWNQILLAML
ncbi:protein trichome birefringence-like 3 isoform X1 [Arachis stenosperma]|uniref:protein trichome birefringence-like 3 isoform X1 n=1 Tax=Arachis stenosperma TaxID=217475 RepID=UPI0025AD2C76|nr:protein trichome birefringence-like 3 isoform X1 [Arachis stenosperma]